MSEDFDVGGQRKKKSDVTNKNLKTNQFTSRCSIFSGLTFSIRASRRAESEVELLPEHGPVVRVDELKHALVDHVRLREGEGGNV